MRKLALLVAVVISGCTQHHDELKAIQAGLDSQLAVQQARADNLNTLRKELDALEQQVIDGVASTPAADEELKALRAKAPPTAPLARTFPALPPEGSFEGVEGKRLRMRIADTEARIAQLGKVIGELEKLEARRERLKQELQIIEARRGLAK